MVSVSSLPLFNIVVTVVLLHLPRLLLF
jgi:hypothetical protein